MQQKIDTEVRSWETTKNPLQIFENFSWNRNNIEKTLQ